MAKLTVHPFVGQNGPAKMYYFYCPACDERHGYTVIDGDEAEGKIGWAFDGNLETPTFSPSLQLLTAERKTTCHLHVRAGMIEYCGDAPHAMAGERVPMVDL